MSEPSVGVYVHVPFCDRVCPYCDFAVVGGGLSRADEQRYVAALEREIDARAAAFSGRRLASVYLGGGTPSLIEPDSALRILAAVRRAFPSTRDAVEVTLEVNPSTLERRRLPGFRAAGVNRLSLGIQSFNDVVLKRLGRAHRAAEGHETLVAAREAGFDNISLDLLFAAPGQTLQMLAADLAEIVGAAPEHVSAYELVVEEGTPFALAERRGQLRRADADEAAEMMEAIDGEFARAGLVRYELTNYARAGYASIHNTRYWEREPVLGVGVGAWSSEPSSALAPWGARRMNARRLAEYLDRVEAGTSTAVSVEVHAVETARSEAVFLALRRTVGLNAERFWEDFGAPPRAFYGEAIDRLSADGLLTETASGDLKLTDRGRMLSDLVSQQFV